MFTCFFIKKIYIYLIIKVLIFLVNIISLLYKLLIF